MQRKAGTRALRALAALLLLGASACQTAQAPLDVANPGGFDVLRYDVRLEPDFGTRTIRSETRIEFRSLHDGLRALSLTDPGPEVEVTGAARSPDGRLAVPLAAPVQAGQAGSVVLSYSGSPAYGLTFSETGFHSEYFSCGWMACDIDAFGDKAAIRLALTLPAGLQSLGPGTAGKVVAAPDGRAVHRWTETRDFPAYVYAVAAGDWRRWETEAEGKRLTVQTEKDSADDLARRFAPSADVLAFLTRRAGTPMPSPAYVQLLVDGASAQEASGHSVIGRDALGSGPPEPGSDWVIVHEMAHQWWGNAITAVSLKDFWLNEGIVVFLTAAWEEEQWGREAYEAELGRARARLEKAGPDVAALKLAHPGPWPSLGKRRAVQYGKGALFMEALRAELGDEAFWRAFAHYTRTNMGRSVTSADLQAAFEASSGRDLQALFDAWVYP